MILSNWPQNRLQKNSVIWHESVNRRPTTNRNVKTQPRGIFCFVCWQRGLTDVTLKTIWQSPSSSMWHRAHWHTGANASRKRTVVHGRHSAQDTNLYMCARVCVWCVCVCVCVWCGVVCVCVCGVYVCVCVCVVCMCVCVCVCVFFDYAEKICKFW
jgi:hypothetical protein